MKYLKRMSKQEKREMNAKKIDLSLQGEGKYLFKNNTKGDLKLPKTSLEGKKIVVVNETFLGDSYFLQMVKTNDLLLLEKIEDKTEIRPIIVEEKPVEIVKENTETKIIFKEKSEVEEKTIGIVEENTEVKMIPVKEKPVVSKEKTKEKTKEKIDNKETSKKRRS